MKPFQFFDEMSTQARVSPCQMPLFKNWRGRFEQEIYMISKSK